MPSSRAVAGERGSRLRPEGPRARGFDKHPGIGKKGMAHRPARDANGRNDRPKQAHIGSSERCRTERAMEPDLVAERRSNAAGPVPMTQAG